MSSLSTKNNINNAKNFAQDIASGSNAYYYFVGKASSWPDDTNPPATLNTIEDTEQSIYHDMIFGKLLTNSNIQFLIPNIPWTNNTVYVPYDQSNSSYAFSNSYVVTSDLSVYKCIDNALGNSSIVQPSIKPTAGTFKTSDGYVWKYLFTIPTNMNTNFGTPYYVPVAANSLVANNTIPGTIDVIRVENGGANWQAYATGYVNYVINQGSIVLDANAVAVDNFYTGSSIYLAGGLARDQIRQIVAYNGSTRVASVSPPIDTFINLQLDSASITGTFEVGQIVSQNLAYINYVYSKGTMNFGDLLIQSDTQAQGNVWHSNTSVVQLGNISGSFSASPAYPFYNSEDSFFQLTGTVSVTKSSNVITGVTANLLTVPINSYIFVGSNTSFNVRRLASVQNSTHGTVTIPFANTLANNAWYQVNNAIEPTSIQISSSSGQVYDVNLTSIEILYGNTSAANLSFILGETVKEYDVNGIDQSANAIVSFVNSSTLILSDVNGSLSIGNFLVGQSSTQKAQINSIVNYPNITLQNTVGTFISGESVYAYYSNGSAAGIGTCLASSFTPSYNTQYVISPTVTISGDGSNALAFCTVNTATGSSYEITGIKMVDIGKNYTYATAQVSSNGLYGRNAVLYPVVSPIKGHGYDPVTELGARFIGISITFDTPVNENYYFPFWSVFRKVGIIKNPLFKSLDVQHDTPDRLDMVIQTISGPFTNGEIIYQPQTQAAGVVYSVGSNTIEIAQISGTFSSNAAQTGVNNMIQGLSSGATANVVSTNAANFVVSSNAQLITQANTNATAYLSQVINATMITLANVNGKFVVGKEMIDLTNNTYANATALYVANGSRLTTTFGQRFSQISRITISTNTNLAFQAGEFVRQDTSNASGTILSTNTDIDIPIQSVAGTFSGGIVLTDANTSATATILYANSTYLKVTNVSGVFNSGDTVTCLTGNAVITAVFPVISVYDIPDDVYFQYNYNITGQNSGAVGYTTISNTITYPDLTYNSGDVIYVNNLLPFNTTASSKETFLTIIEF